MTGIYLTNLSRIMLISDRQILKLPHLLKIEGQIQRISEFYEQTGIPKSWFSNVKNSEKRDRAYHFTAAQIKIICDLYRVNANWIMGIEDNWQRNSVTSKGETTVLKNTKKAQNKINN